MVPIPTGPKKVEVAKREIEEMTLRAPLMVVEPVTVRAEVVAPTAVKLVKSVFVAKRLVEVALVVVPLIAKRFWMSPLVEKRFVEVALVEVALVTVRLFPAAVRKEVSPVLETENSVVVAVPLVVEEMRKTVG